MSTNWTMIQMIPQTKSSRIELMQKRRPVENLDAEVPRKWDDKTLQKWQKFVLCLYNAEVDL